MKNGLYNKEISPQCEYCIYGRLSPDGETVLCPKKGIVTRDFHCRKYKYDIMKRTPKKAPRLTQFDEEDFSL